MDGTTAAARVVAESAQTFAGDPAATAAVSDIAPVFAQLRLESSLSPFERRVAYLTGIRSRKRRRLLKPTSDNFQIVDDPPGGGQFGKRWRLFEQPSGGGQVLLFAHTKRGAMTNVEYIPYHICSSKTVLHRIYHDAQYPSHLLLPVIPNG